MEDTVCHMYTRVRYQLEGRPTCPTVSGARREARNERGGLRERRAARPENPRRGWLVGGWSWMGQGSLWSQWTVGRVEYLPTRKSDLPQQRLLIGWERLKVELPRS